MLRSDRAPHDVAVDVLRTTLEKREGDGLEEDFHDAKKTGAAEAAPW
jgi:hypothetical protein